MTQTTLPVTFTVATRPPPPHGIRNEFKSPQEQVGILDAVFLVASQIHPPKLRLLGWWIAAGFLDHSPS
jgi:hypothetical protein